jgi:hypothetical protein
VIFDNKINEIKREHAEYVKRTYYLRKEYTDEEYAEMINKIDNEIKNTLTSYTNNNELRKAYLEQLNSEKELIERDMKKAKEFQDYLLMKREEFLNIPRTIDDVISQCIEYIKKQVNYYHKDLTEYYFEKFVETIKAMCPEDKDYSKTISSVYRSKNSKKAMDIIQKYFDLIKNELIKFLMKLKQMEHSKMSCSFLRLKKDINNQATTVISKIHLVICNFIDEQLSLVDNTEMSDSRIVKIYTETVMAQMNQSLMFELPPLLDEYYKNSITNAIANIQIRIGYKPDNKPITNEVLNEKVDEEIVDDVVNVLENSNPTMNSFLNQLPEEKIEISVLVGMYNNYFNKSISNIGFGKLKEIKSNFTVEKKNERGKKKTYYLKNPSTP